MEKISKHIVLSIQSINDIITNSSSEVVIKYDKEGVQKIKELVNNLIKPFTTLTFDDLFELYFIKIDGETDEETEISENDESLEDILEDSWRKTWDGGWPEVQRIQIRTKKGKEVFSRAADLLENIAKLFDTDVIYG